MLFWLVFLLPFILIFIYFAILQRFFRAVEKEDAELWEQIGRPHILKNNNIGNGIAVLTCLFSSSYKKSSPSVIKLGHLSKLFLLICIVAMIAYPYLLKAMGIQGN